MANNNQGPRTQRLFFALWPDEGVRARIEKAVVQLPVREGRRVPRDNLHITLVFLGSVAESSRRCVEGVADGIQASPFSLSLDQVGYWPRPRVVWLGASTIPDKLARLEAALSQGIAQCGIEVENRPYAPHMTLLRKVSRPARLGSLDPIEWRVDHFALVESVTNVDGAVYQVLKRWALG
jgi:2'-5' RNA ligase